MTDFARCLRHYTITAELQKVAASNLSGLYVLPRSDTMHVWDCVLFVRQGIYADATIKFRLIIPEDYPSVSVPRIVFAGHVFHPCVDPISNELNIKHKFPQWRAGQDHLYHVLAYVRRVFYRIEPDGAVNTEACSLLQENADVFSIRVRDCLRQWDTNTYTTHDDDFAIKFSRRTKEEVDMIKQTGYQLDPASSTPQSLAGYTFVADREQRSRSVQPSAALK